MRVAIASDHAGFQLRRHLRHRLEGYPEIILTDLGPENTDPVDYPSYAGLLAKMLQAGHCDWGILICGSGLGMSIAANRYEGVRAALCRDELSARMARRHNDANVLVFGERFTGLSLAEAILDAWLESAFEGGRHSRRVALIDASLPSSHPPKND